MKDYRIKIYILPDGFVKTALESREGQPVPFEGMALFKKIEPILDRFKKEVSKVLSSQDKTEKTLGG